MDCVIQFRDALQAAYGPLDWLPIPDGGIHRVHLDGDKQGSLNGWYVLHADGIASAVSAVGRPALRIPGAAANLSTT